MLQDSLGLFPIVSDDAPIVLRGFEESLVARELLLEGVEFDTDFFAAFYSFADGFFLG